MISAHVHCAEFVELVTDWMEGALDDELVAHIEEHLAFCAWCSDYLKQIRATTSALGELDAEAPVPAREELLALFRAYRRP